MDIDTAKRDAEMARTETNRSWEAMDDTAEEMYHAARSSDRGCFMALLPRYRSLCREFDSNVCLAATASRILREAQANAIAQAKAQAKEP